jgi:SAM-dependent methyltransferase
MPDKNDLARMYGVDYWKVGGGTDTDDPRERVRVLDWLRKLGAGTFIDFGCGKGVLLAEAAALGWRVAGVEMDPAVAGSVAGATNLTVVSDPERLVGSGNAPADVVHLGDVVEHLADLEAQWPAILGLVKPGGILLSQGPLEASPTLFTLALRLSRAVRPRESESPPYHVLLATAAGQRTFFRRFGLEEIEYIVREVSWPAPSRLAVRDLVRPRLVALFLARRLSQAVSALFPNRMGNRYFFAGRRPVGAPGPAYRGATGGAPDRGRGVGLPFPDTVVD